MNTKMGPPGLVGTAGLDPYPTPVVLASAGPSGGPPTGPGMTSGVRVRLFGRTDVGRIREHNEDNFLVADLTQGVRGLTENIRTHVVGPCGTLFAVCDGMGGAAAGEVASKLAVDIIYDQMQAGGAPRHREEFARRLVRAIEVAGLRIFAEAKLDRNRRGMGTTATAAALIDDFLFLAQVGDSRAYVLRGEKLEQVTRDQSLVNQLIEAGQLTEEEAENFEHSNIILQALGTADSVQVDLTYVRLKQGDTLLLCSDGLSGMVRSEELRQILLTYSEPIDACKVLTDRANEAGGHDNITVIIAKFDGLWPAADGDEPLKYTKYTFQTEDPSYTIPTSEVVTAPGIQSAMQADVRPQAAANAQVSRRLHPTQLSVQVPEFLQDLRIEASRQPEPPPTMPEFDSGTGFPKPSKAWMVVATLLAIAALGLVVIGVYALLGGKLPP